MSSSWWTRLVSRIGGKSDASDPDVDESVRRLCASLLAGVEAPRVVVLGDPGGALVRGLAHEVPNVSLQHHVGMNDSRRHALLAAAGPYDLVVDDSRRPAPRPRRFVDTFYHLAPGGALVVVGGAPGGRPARQLAPVLARAVATRDTEPPAQVKGAPLGPIDAHALGRTLGEQTSVDGHLVVRSAGPTPLAKLDEEQIRIAAEAAPDLVRITEIWPADAFISKAVMTTGSVDVETLAEEEVEAPRIDLREYRDVVVAPGQVVATDRLLLPDSFRHHLWRRLRNSNTDEVAARFASLRWPTDNLPVLEGTYLHLDNEVRGHFGHLLTEQVSRFWSWRLAKEQWPDAKVLLTNSKGRELAEWELGVYAAAGIDAEDIEFVRTPVRVDRLISGTPLMSHPQYVHPRLRAEWAELGDTLTASAAERDRPRRIFCSRRLKKRSCHNSDEVEQIFAARGFTVLYPEDHPLGEQVALFRAAEVIGGFAGSGLFQICFVPEPTHVITVGSESYTARNEYLFASLLGHRIDAVTCRPDDPSRFQSAFTFDHEREGVRLTTLLDALG